jgi:molecular chaperone GrpE
MYKQMIPADVVAREAQSGGPADRVSKPMPSHEVSAAQTAEAESKYIVALQKQLAAEGERWLRLAADFENFKKRAAQELDKRATAQKDALVRDLLPIIDNLERALASAAAASVGHMYDGIQITWQQLIQVMREHGFEMREDIGEPFDPKYHDAVSTRSEPARPHHMILEVWQRGWLRGKDLFRPAKVVVNDLNSRHVNYVDGANIAGFREVAEVVLERGVT